MGIWYRTGTVAVTNGSPNVVGVGTLWLTQASIGDIFMGPDLVEYEITSITDDTHLALKQINGTAAYAGATNSAQVYAIIRNFTSTMPAQLASQLAAMMTAWHVTTDELTAWLSGTGTVTVHDAVGNAYSVQTPAALNAAVTGRLVKSVAGGADVTLTSAEASNLFIELTGALTANINLILPAGVRHNFILNSTTGAYAVTVKTASGSGVVAVQGGRMLLECDATNVVNAFTALDNCTSNTESAANNSTQLATTAYADRLTGGTLAGAFTTLSVNSTLSTVADFNGSHASGTRMSYSNSGVARAYWGACTAVSGVGSINDTDLYSAGVLRLFGSGQQTAYTSFTSTGLAVTGDAVVYSGGKFATVGTTGILATLTSVSRFLWDDVQFYPSTDNNKNLGTASFRFGTVYAGTGTINTSDARHKTSVSPLSANEINAAKQLSKDIGTYQWLESIQKKGDAARRHVGFTVQRAIEILQSNGCDPFSYGFICYDKWDDVFVEHAEILPVAAKEAVLGVDGNIVEPAIEAVEAKAAWTELTTAAGDAYAFRYDQLNMFVAAGLEARLSALESR